MLSNERSGTAGGVDRAQAQQAPPPKSIILFSDGTGNSSAKLFKTNVWRMYEAVDLGVNPAGGNVQVAYYDNGVGTQGIKALAMLAGIFGFGLKRAILRLYRFVCRNYEEGDSIYAFGFSRGAFTIRMVAALIADQGVVRYCSETELEARSLDAFRRFSASNNPHFTPLIGRAARAVRNKWIAGKRFVIGPRLDPKITPLGARIRFLGVWDTVAAYGGPITEITRGIDALIYPLSMSDTRLDPKIDVARHALAIDDERDAFHPVLWDEFSWAELANETCSSPVENRIFRDRLKQVWFSGMHADVGGGYPDESLSYVSLCWMMAEAKAQDLRLLEEHEKRVHDMSNSLGPIYDSRGGFGSYYRYQPRKIAAYLHPESGNNLVAKTIILRDPVIGLSQKRPQGQLLRCRIHESVIARICHGTDDYSPITLPPKIEVEPFTAGTSPGGNPDLPAEVVTRVEERNPAWWDWQERLWDGVWRRRLLYFAMVALSLALLLSPLWPHWLAFPRRTDDRWVSQRLTGWSDYLIPDLLDPWVHAFETAPLPFLGLLLAIPLLRLLSGREESKIRAKIRTLWMLKANGFTIPPAPGSWQANLRGSASYQWLFHNLKWRILPSLFGLAIIFLILYLLAVIASQAILSVREQSLCKPEPNPAALAEVGPAHVFTFSTATTCNKPFRRVVKDHRYSVTFRVEGEEKQWSDGGVKGTPAGIRAGKLGAVGYLGMPFRRVIDGHYLQPIYQIRPVNRSTERVPQVALKNLKLAGEDGTQGHDCRLFQGIFTAEESGELLLFANEATFFGETSFFYRDERFLGQQFRNGNKGVARVMIRDLDAPPTVSNRSADDWLSCRPAQ